MPPRIPTEADFAPLSSSLTISLHFPSPPESITTFLILFHGLGDYEAPFAGFARNLSLPGVLGISVRGTSPLPPSMLSGAADGDDQPHFHWGDDLTLDTSTGDLDDDPGFEKARGLVVDKLIKETLIERCGWEFSDVILFGFGQGGSLALGLASQLRTEAQVTDVTDVADGDENSMRPSSRASYKGAVSIGGALPSSMVPPKTSSARRERSKTPVLVCQLDEQHADAVKREFVDVKAVRWKRRDVAMPRDREEVLPIMKFFAERLNSGW